MTTNHGPDPGYDEIDHSSRELMAEIAALKAERDSLAALVGEMREAWSLYCRLQGPPECSCLPREDDEGMERTCPACIIDGMEAHIALSALEKRIRAETWRNEIRQWLLDTQLAPSDPPVVAEVLRVRAMDCEIMALEIERRATSEEN